MDTLIESLNDLKIDSTDQMDNLSKLAVELREESNRSALRLTSNLPNLLKSAQSVQSNDLMLQILRVLINSVAYNNTNRFTLVNDTSFGSVIEKLLHDEQLSNYSLILLQNMIIFDESEDNKDVDAIQQIVHKLVDHKIVNMLFEKCREAVTEMNNDESIDIDNYEQLFDLLASILTASSTSFVDLAISIKATDVEDLANVLLKYASSESAEPVTVEFLYMYDILAHLLYNESETEIDMATPPQKTLFQILETLSIMESGTDRQFTDEFKKINRKIFAAIGNLSSNRSTDNKTCLKLAFETLENASVSKSKNTYVVSSCFLIVANSIQSEEDRDAVLKEMPHLISVIFACVKPDYSNLSEYLHIVTVRNEVSEKEKKLRDEITFFTEPLVDQSLFHLLKLLLVSSKPPSNEYFVTEFKESFSLLKSLILFSFDNMFFTRVNFTLIVALLKNVVRNFLQYGNDHQWFVDNSVEIIESLVYSLNKKQSKDEVVKIKELDSGKKKELINLIQVMVNVFIEKNVLSNDLLELMVGSILNEAKSEEVVGIGNDPTANTTNDSRLSPQDLSQKFVTLTILVSTSNEISIKFVKQNIEKLHSIVNESFEMSSDSGLQIDGLKNNLKVFLVKLKYFSDEHDFYIPWLDAKVQQAIETF